MTVPKLTLELAPGSCLGEIALTEMLANQQLDTISVVVRENDGLKWIPRSERARRGGGAELRILPCKQAALGMSYSLREGLTDALSLEPGAIMIVLADQPFITSDLLDSLISAYRAQPDLDYVACTGDRMAMPPALFAPSMFDALGELEGDAGARKLLASTDYRGLLVPVSSSDVFADVDTPSDLKEARRYWNDRNRKGGCADETDGNRGNAPDMQAIR